jgi:hypothetical protein
MQRFGLRRYPAAFDLAALFRRFFFAANQYSPAPVEMPLKNQSGGIAPHSKGSHLPPTKQVADACRPGACDVLPKNDGRLLDCGAIPPLLI